MPRFWQRPSSSLPASPQPQRRKRQTKDLGTDDGREASLRISVPKEAKAAVSDKVGGTTAVILG
ncbi:hypothetical protein CBOM_02662 [Ceraceosorus bombacis]|uniref:Uncharacterized protein n=1 Tax=Ceraceosorus bombacis TaxID=401625 RepID=A0A0P1BGG8_9BASI|nr:hypothetical protein CBOM_02662 [Ceraceosorus bombacis]